MEFLVNLSSLLPFVDLFYITASQSPVAIGAIGILAIGAFRVIKLAF